MNGENLARQGYALPNHQNRDAEKEVVVFA
jgi:hypothetical protein